MKWTKYFLFTFTLSVIFVTEGYSATNLFEMDPLEVRDRINQGCMSVEAETTEVFFVENKSVERDGRSTDIRLYYPGKVKEWPLVLMIHGGAWVAGNLDTHDNMARYICHNAKAMVISVGYKNSPEGKFPGILEQCYDALLWTEEFGADYSPLAVVGDSAGGNMAAALCLLTRDRRGPKIGMQVLINPVTDLRGNGTLEPQGDNLDNLRWNATMYVANPQDVNLPYVSPAIATDLSLLPPAMILVAEYDAHRADGEHYSKLLQAAEVPVNLYCQWGVGHLAGNGARASYDARESLDVAVTALRGYFKRA